MTVEQKIADMQQASVEQTQASQALADEVAGKMGEIDKKLDEGLDQVLQDSLDFKSSVKQLFGFKNLLPDPAFTDSVLGLGVPNGFGFQVLYGAVATIEVAELNESDKAELAVVLGNSNAFTPKESSAFYAGKFPRKIVISQTVEGSAGSALRLSCPVGSLPISPLYMKLVKAGAITKRTGKTWMNGVQAGMYFSKGDIDDGNVFQLGMNGVATWEIFMPWMILESDEMIYSNF